MHKTKTKTIIDTKYKFIAKFDLETGVYFRTGIIKEDKISYSDPFMASFPHLIDIGIMGHCQHGKSGLCVKAGVQCYQMGLTKHQSNMDIEAYKNIIDQCRDKVFQVALGGRGDPDLHENFEEILVYTRNNEIVPNITTSGYALTESAINLIAKHCGAVAVSWYRSSYTLKAIKAFISANVKTNIHYVLSNETIDEAIYLLKNKNYPKGVNRLIFLLHKPVGLGDKENVLRFSNPKVKEFFSLFKAVENAEISGFDSCCVPGLIHYAPNLLPMTYDTCEASRYSGYITPDLYMTPCSFDQELKWGVSLKEKTIEEVWNSSLFNDFRRALKSNCKWCRHLKRCYGGCPISRDIVLCDKVQGGVNHEDKN